MIVILDASIIVSAALKQNGLPEQALLKAMRKGNTVILSQDLEDEYREVLARPKFDRFVSFERRMEILSLILLAAERIEPVGISS